MEKRMTFSSFLAEEDEDKTHPINDHLFRMGFRIADFLRYQYDVTVEIWEDTWVTAGDGLGCIAITEYKGEHLEDFEMEILAKYMSRYILDNSLDAFLDTKIDVVDVLTNGKEIRNLRIRVKKSITAKDLDYMYEIYHNAHPKTLFIQNRR